ncbi:hypothetical protein UFOVP907_42 [uncultured Caudovirales phage]|jgi:hypothetical protein|uniref:Uncharacterized protein n=1 Tax=uncultured Caudovirales phage TaxID=2100421 RepID=A0A6J5PDL6_9CAUD|nr:hypothetical protein UFOVP907_42 [uncultured Caudovirales phage]
MNNLDLVDEMDWEDSDKVTILTLDEAGLEEPSLETETHRYGNVFRSGIIAYLDWFYDGESSEYTE